MGAYRRGDRRTLGPVSLSPMNPSPVVLILSDVQRSLPLAHGPWPPPSLNLVARSVERPRPD